MQKNKSNSISLLSSAQLSSVLIIEALKEALEMKLQSCTASPLCTKECMFKVQVRSSISQTTCEFITSINEEMNLQAS